MGIQLVITEKPSVASDVAKALSGQDHFERVSWGFRGQQFWVTAAAGHLLAELNPDEYDERFATWVFDDLPIIPDVIRYKPRDQRAAERLATITSLLRDPAVTSVINACDAGREGEHIAKLVIAAAELPTPKPVWRAWFSSMTEQAIVQAFAGLRPDRELLPLETAARCRSAADWLVGINATRAATCTLGGRRSMFSLGRVQTPTLALVVQRDLEIENFTSCEYFTVDATFSAETGMYTGTWRENHDSDARDRFDDRDAAERVASATRNAASGIVDSVDAAIERSAPPKLFDLTGLQREAHRRYGMTAAQTLVAAQACYEVHKVLTYPRTDSTHITTDMSSGITTLVDTLCAVAPFTTAAQQIRSDGVDPSPFVNDAKVSDHHGLLPTGDVRALADLSTVERHVFDLVVWRLLAALSPEQVQERTIVWTRVGSSGDPFWFRSVGVRVVDPGWKAVWPPSRDDDDGQVPDQLPALTGGGAVSVDDAAVVSHWTKAPNRFNEASLLGVMATAGKLVDDTQAAEAMKERGLGTPATRAAIIEKLIKIEYLERRQRQLVATNKGRGLIVALGDHPLVKPELTGDWESQLRDIERCDPDLAATAGGSFTQRVKEFTEQVVASFAHLTPSDTRRGQRQLAPCPLADCDGSIVAGRKGWGCTSWVSRDQPGCGFVWWFDQGGKKRTEKQLLAFIAAVRDGSVTVPVRGPAVVLGTCPTASCGGSVVERTAGWGCNSWKGPKQPGCGFVIWRQNADGSCVDRDQAAVLLAEGRTNTKPRPAALRPCPMPRCDGEIIERERNFSCTSWKGPRRKGCGLTLWKTAKDGTVLVTADTLDEQLAAAVNSAT